MTSGGRRSPGDEEPDTDSVAGNTDGAEPTVPSSRTETSQSEAPQTADTEATHAEGTEAAHSSRTESTREASAESTRTGGTEPTPTAGANVTDESGSARAPTTGQSTAPDEPLWRRFWTAEDGPLLFLREFLLSAAIVLVVGLLLFGLSGVWPPMVAVESESMEPNINQYDLVFVTEPGRFAPDGADQQGIVNAESGEVAGYESFNQPGSVIVFTNPEATGPPIIHRAHFFVKEGENWHSRANPAYINADSCDALSNCPATHDGYITKGDNENSNQRYDQANGIAPIVKPGWVDGVARVRVPYLGWIRLTLTGAASVGPVLPVGIAAIGGATAYTLGRRSHH